MITWFQILLGVITLADKLSSYLKERQLITLAQAATAADALKRVHDALRAGDAVDVSAGGLRKHDQFERHD